LKKSDPSEQKSGSGLFIGSDPLSTVTHRASASDDTDAGKDRGDDDSTDSDKTDTDTTDKGDSDDRRDTDGKD
jgi:hypothetical protein